MIAQTNVIIVHERKSHFAIYLRERLVKAGFEVFLLSDEMITNRKVFCHISAQGARLEIEVKNGITVLGDSIALIVYLSVQPWNYQGVCDNGNSYEYMAWLAFWLFGQQIVGRVINRVDHKMLSVSSMCLPRVYEEMKKVGIIVPKWRFDSQAAAKVKEDESRHHIWQACDFRSQLTEGCLLLGRKEGLWVVCLYVFGRLFVKRTDVNDEIALPDDLAAKIKSLCQGLGFDMMEVLFLYMDKTWVGYGVSVQPDLDKRWKSHWPKMVDLLLKSTERTVSKKKKHTRKCFIKKKYLPLVE